VNVGNRKQNQASAAKQSAPLASPVEQDQDQDEEEDEAPAPAPVKKPAQTQTAR